VDKALAAVIGIKDQIRFWSKVEKTVGCWIWTACVGGGGHGLFWADGKQHRAHRWIWEQAHGPLPVGLMLDHVKARGCTSRACVNLAHLEPVTNRENLRRSENTLASIYAAKTHCPQGHEYTDENTYRIKTGGRACRVCRNAATRRYAAKQKAS